MSSPMITKHLKKITVQTRNDAIREYNGVIEKLRTALIKEATIRKAYTRSYMLFASRTQSTKGVSKKEAEQITNAEFLKQGTYHNMGVGDIAKTTTDLQKLAVVLNKTLSISLPREEYELVNIESLYRIHSRFGEIAPDPIADTLGTEIRSPELHAAKINTQLGASGKKAA